MNEYKIAALKKMAALLVLAISITMVIIGQKTISFKALGMMLTGLSGILLILYLYNRSYTKKRRTTLPPEQERNKNE